MENATDHARFEPQQTSNTRYDFVDAMRVAKEPTIPNIPKTTPCARMATRTLALAHTLALARTRTPPTTMTTAAELRGIHTSRSKICSYCVAIIVVIILYFLN